jgi:hypothetical protein
MDLQFFENGLTFFEKSIILQTVISHLSINFNQEII